MSPDAQVNRAVNDADRAALDIESQSWRYGALKDEAIRVAGTPPARHDRRVHRLVNEGEALAHAPATVHRPRRLLSRQ